MSLNLCLHSGGVKVAREQVLEVRTPAATDSWFPVPHHRIIEQVESSLTSAGLRIVDQQHGLWRDGQRYFGMMEVRNCENAPDYGLIVGLRNSHDKAFSASLALGSSVFVCDNLSFSGEVTLARKHTRFIERDLPRIVSAAVAKLTDQRGKQDARFAAYKAKELTDTQAHDLLIRAIDAKVLPVSNVPATLKEWRAPSHPEFAAGKTAWRLFNAFTETFKGVATPTVVQRSQALHGLLDTECALALSA